MCMMNKGMNKMNERMRGRFFIILFFGCLLFLEGKGVSFIFLFYINDYYGNWRGLLEVWV